MLTLYNRHKRDELIAIADHCRSFCDGQHSPALCEPTCTLRRVCKEFTQLAEHCEVRMGIQNSHIVK